MSEWTRRLQQRISERRLTKAAVIRAVGIDQKTLDRFLAGALDHGLQPEQFLRLCEVLEVTPDQVLGFAPMDGEGISATSEHDAMVTQIVEKASALPSDSLPFAADIIDRLAHHRGRPDMDK